MIKNIIIAILVILLLASVTLAQYPIPAGWIADANGTDGADPSKFILVNETTGEQIPVATIVDYPTWVKQQGTKRQAIIDIGQNIVGADVRELTATQQKILLGLLALRAGAIDANLDIRPLGEWMK